MAGEEKTEKATPKRRKDSREKEGNVLQSKDVTVAVAVLGGFIMLSVFAKLMYQLMLNLLSEWIGSLGNEFMINSEFMMQNALRILFYCVVLVMPLAISIGALSILPTIIQTKGLFTMKPLKPKFSKLNPFTGIKRLFSLQSLVGVLKGIIEVIVIFIIIYTQIQDIIPEIRDLMDMDLIQGVVYTAQKIMDIVIIISVLLVFIGAGDFIFQWWQFEKKLKMSKQEIKDEYKQSEGDPQIKSKIKQKQREIANNRMMEEVPASDVVVRNPTHYAIAIKYDRTNVTSAPVVVAKGQDAIAMKIIAIAEENDVYITENRPLAKLMYETIDVGKEIPPELYTTVSVILTDMYEAKGIKLDTGKRQRKSLYN